MVETLISIGGVRTIRVSSTICYLFSGAMVRMGPVNKVLRYRSWLSQIDT